MKKQSAVVLMVASCVTMLAGGCTRNEVVHTDQVLAAAASTAQPKAAPTETAKPEAPNQQPTRQRAAADGAGPESAAAEPMQRSLQQGKLAAVMESIRFDFDQHLLSPEAREILQKNAEKLKSEPQARVRIAGHCDERGSDDYNLALSERRARAAMQYLIALGVPAERLSVIGFGKEKPLAAGHDEASWAQNRRDDFEMEGP